MAITTSIFFKADSKLSKFVVFEKPLVFVEPYFEESIYITPSNLSNVIVEEAQSKIEKACQKLGLTNGPIHAEFKIANDEVFLIEINPRIDRRALLKMFKLWII